MEIIVLQHINIEDPGYLKDLLIQDQANITTIELDVGEKIPNNLNKFDLQIEDKLVVFTKAAVGYRKLVQV